MKTEEIALSRVSENEANPRTITEANFQKLVKSILVFPKMLQLRPIVVDETYKALGGNMRTKDLELRETLIWNKDSLCLGRQDYQWKHEPCLYGWKNGGAHNWFNDRAQTTVIDMARPKVSREHPTMKPVPLFAYLMGNSTKEGWNVYGGFGGSGTTLIAAEQLNRNAFLMELDPHYCDVIIARWEKLTGEKAVKIDEFKKRGE